MPKSNLSNKSAVADTTGLPESANDTVLYTETLAALDKIEVEMKRIVPALDQHTMETTDPRERTALHHARGACVDWITKFATVRRRASKVDCGEHLLPVSLKG
jgi:hypothetical protein